MSKISRLFHKIFGANADFGYQMGKFGSFKNGSPQYAANASDIQSLSNFEQGLYGSLVGDGAPFAQDINAVLHHSSRQLGYLYQQGIPEWDSQTTYYINSFVSYNGAIFKSIVDTNLNIAPSGSSTSWQQITGEMDTFKNPIPFLWQGYGSNLRDVAQCGLVCYNGFAYLVGGITATAISPYVLRFKMLPDGELLDLGQLEFHLTSTAVKDNECIFHKGYIYSLGGATGGAGNGTTTVMRSQVNIDGTLTAWTNLTGLFKAVAKTSAFINGNQLYLVGGVDSTGAITNEVQVATLNANGSIGAWSHHSNLPTADIGKTVVIGKYVYFFGISKIQRSILADDGSISAFFYLGAISGNAFSGINVVVIGEEVFYFGTYSGSTYVKIFKLSPSSEFLQSPDRRTVGLPANSDIFLVNKGKIYAGFNSAAIVNTSSQEVFKKIGVDVKEDLTKSQIGFSDNGVISCESLYTRNNFANWKMNK